MINIHNQYHLRNLSLTLNLMEFSITELINFFNEKMILTINIMAKNTQMRLDFYQQMNERFFFLSCLFNSSHKTQKMQKSYLNLKIGIHMDLCKGLNR